MNNNQKSINTKLEEDVYNFVKNNAMAGSLSCFYHFDYTNISVEELHSVLLYLYDKGFNAEFDVCAHIHVDWSKASRGEAAELKTMANKVRKSIWKVTKRLYKKKFIAISSNEPFYENIKKSLEIDEMDGCCKLNYVSLNGEEYLLAVDSRISISENGKQKVEIDNKQSVSANGIAFKIDL